MLSLANIRSLHSTCVAIKDQGILIIGKPGSGKSLIALALLQYGHQLVSDDLTILTKKNGKLVATCPIRIKKLLYVRGIGFIHVIDIFGKQAVSEEVNIHFILDLDNQSTLYRVN